MQEGNTDYLHSETGKRGNLSTTVIQLSDAGEPPIYRVPGIFGTASSKSTVDGVLPRPKTDCLLSRAWPQDSEKTGLARGDILLGCGKAISSSSCYGHHESLTNQMSRRQLVQICTSLPGAGPTEIVLLERSHVMAYEVLSPLPKVSV
jgi:hypothetical protein